MNDTWVDRVIESDWLYLIIFGVIGVLCVVMIIGAVGLIFFPDNSHHFYMNCDHRLVLEGKVWVQMWDCTG